MLHQLSQGVDSTLDRGGTRLNNESSVVVHKSLLYVNTYNIGGLDETGTNYILLLVLGTSGTRDQQRPAPTAQKTALQEEKCYGS